MRIWRRAAAGFLALILCLSLLPMTMAQAADTAAAEGTGVQITQSAQWDASVPGGAAAKVTVSVSTVMDLQKPKDVVFVVDCSALQNLNAWKANAKSLAGYLRTVPGMRAALVSYASTPVKQLDFTGDFSALTAKIDALTKGVNSDAYAALRLAESMINSRSAPRNPACVAYFGNGRFNMNYHKTLEYAPELLKTAPVYCVLSGSSDAARSELNKISGNRIRTPYEAAMEIGESRVCPVTVTGQLDSGFTPSSAYGSTGGGDYAANLNKTTGEASYTASLTMGRSMSLTIYGSLTDTSRTGEIPVAGSASVSLDGQTLTAGPVSLHRGGYRVAYDPNGGTGKVPEDNTLYGAGSTVGLKPASLRRDGWNFSGWIHPTMGIRDGKFNITGDTTVEASWGRAHVKLSSSTLTGLTGTNMLNRSQIEAMDGGSFYDDTYWKNLESITIHNDVVIPDNAEKTWDITDTSGQSRAGAVMAWVTPGDRDGKYQFHIGGRGGVVAPVDCTSLFARTGSKYDSSIKMEGFQYLDTSHVTNMSRMFSASNTGARDLDLSGWDTSNVTNMTLMFSGSYSAGSYWTSLNLSGWDTSKVTSMDAMFLYCPYLSSLNLSGWTTPEVTDIGSMFWDCRRLQSLDLSGWDTSKVTDMSYMFKDCTTLHSLNLGTWETDALQAIKYMFEGCAALPELNVRDWDVSRVTDFERVFKGCRTLTTLDLSGWQTTGRTYEMSMESMFQDCAELTELTLGSDWSLYGVDNTVSMFNGCKKLASLNTVRWQIRRVYRMREMFKDCASLVELDVSDWDITPTSDAYAMFSGCSSLKRLIQGEKFKASASGRYGGMGGSGSGGIDSMFAGCSSLESLDVTGWNFSYKMSRLRSVFEGCSSLKTLTGIENWDTSHVQTFDNMFKDCAALTNVNVSKWKFATPASGSSGSINGIFQNCTNLTNIGTTRWNLPAGYTYAWWRSGANRAMDNVKLYLGSEQSNNDKTTILPPANAALPAAVSAEAPVPEAVPEPEETPVPEPELPGEPEETPELPGDPEETPEPELDPLPGSGEGLDAAPAPQPDPVPEPEENPENAPAENLEEALLLDDGAVLLDGNGRPVYARDKIGVWDCGQVRPSQRIDYSLELQYLGEDVGDRNGVSGLLTVTNPIPAGLTFLPDTLHISGTAGWIDAAASGEPEGTVVREPRVENGVLTFSVTGLSMGAKFTVFYSCTAPAQAPAVYTEFLNTASVDDSGLPDEADPVRHYMLPENIAAPPEKYAVSYRYDAGAPAAAPAYGTVSYAAGTQITLPQPSLPGYRFNGWTTGGTGSVVTDHTVTAPVSFVGSWTEEPIPNVNIQYSFTSPGPGSAAAIQTALLADAVTEAPENSVTAAPALAEAPDGWRFVWQYPAGLTVRADGTFSVGRRSDWPNGVIHITGRWIPMEYTVTYAYDGAPAGAPALPGERAYPCGSAVPLAGVPANTDTHVFLGWTCDAITVEEDRTFAMPQTDVTITGQWAAKPVQADPEVKINPNGGFWRDSDAEQVLPKTEYDRLVAGDQFPDPVRDDGTGFLRWETAADPEGLFDQIVTARWDVPPDPSLLRTVRFDAQGGTPVESQRVAVGGLVRRPADPTRAGYDFRGWHRTPAGTDPWNFALDTVQGDMTLYAKWEEKTYQVSGIVRDSAGNPIEGAHVKIVHEGHQKFWEDDTGADGRYTISGVPNGIYNTVATYQDNEQHTITTTILSIVSNADLPNQIIQFAAGNTNSLLVVEEMPETTPYVVVGGLKAESETIRADTDAATAVEVKMNVAPTDTSQNSGEVGKIRAAAEEAAKRIDPQLLSRVDLILDVDLTKTLTAGGVSNEEKITQSATIMEIVIPYPMAGKDNVWVHRCHNGAAESFQPIITLPERPEDRVDGAFYLDRNANLIHVFAKKFSLYAVSYTTEPPAVTPPAPPAPSGGGGGDRSDPAYIITASAGPGGEIQPAGKVRVPAGGSQTFAIRPDTGCTVRDVLVDGVSVGAVTSYTFQNVRASHTIEASFDAASGGLLNTEDHMDYLHGFLDGAFRPNAPMTRGQAAQMFYNLLRNRDVPGESAFADVPREMWCYEAVSALRNLGVMVGVTEERFEPDRPITRAELVVTAVRFTEHAPAGSAFTDVAETDWYYPQISAAASRGWIGGYPDGTFRPNSPITRAQAAAVINRLLNRRADEGFVDSRPAGLRTFPDASSDHWAYYEIMESANAHDYRVQGSGERWTQLK